ncbi:hypothetical protein ACFVTX_18030 [Agromyces sp. NPDC058136]|uniref:hypothetical protein n=1 Tax=Agromyces sp. NPDC058136 TaxID=3346354 RepID=UPI0036DD8E62
MGDAATWAGVGVSLAVGVVGLVFAVLANRRSKQSNELAKKANRIAAEAVERADRANEIAEHANELGQDANSIARRAAAQGEDESFVEWELKWKKEGSALTLRNVGRDTAYEVALVVAGDRVHEHKPVGDLEAGEARLIPLPEIGEERVKFDAKQTRLRTDSRYSGILRGFDTFEKELKVTLLWKTESRFPRSEPRELKAS